jgi:hypothetical protein
LGRSCRAGVLRLADGVAEPRFGERAPITCRSTGHLDRSYNAHAPASEPAIPREQQSTATFGGSEAFTARSDRNMAVVNQRSLPNRPSVRPYALSTDWRRGSLLLTLRTRRQDVAQSVRQVIDQS